MKNLSGPIALIRKSVNIFFDKKNLIYFLKIYAILLPFSILSLAENKFVASPTDLIGKYLWLVPFALVFGIAYLLVDFWVGASGIIAVKSVVGRESLSINKVFKSSWKILGLFALLQIIVGFIVGLGFVFLIVPGVLFMTWFHFSSFELITKNAGIKEAILGSKKLVSGVFWKVLGRTVVFGLFGLFIQLILSVLPFRLGSAVFPLFGALLVLPSYLLYKELE